MEFCLNFSNEEFRLKVYIYIYIYIYICMYVYIYIHAHQNLLSFSLLSKTIKVKIYRTIILPVAFYGCETWSFTWWEERRLRVFEKR